MEVAQLPTSSDPSSPYLVSALILVLCLALMCICGLCLVVFRLLRKYPYLAIGKRALDFPGLRRTLIDNNVHCHTHVIGGTGAGKSSFLISQMKQFISQGIGFSFIDPHDTGERLLQLLVSEGYFEKDPTAFERFIFIEFLEDDYFLPLNFLNNPRFKVDTLTDQVLKMFERLWQRLSGGAAPKFEVVMEKSLPVLILNKLPITIMMPLLTNPTIREQLLETIRESHPDIYAWWQDVFAKWSKDQREASIDSTQTRISLVTSAEILKYSLGMVELALDFRRIMDESKFVVYSLKKIKNDKVRKLLGCFLMTAYEEAAKLREDTNDWERVPHHLIIDEFHDFSETSTEGLATMLSTSRKYKVFCWLIHQYWGQNNTHLQGATQMCERKIVFQVGSEDSKVLAEQHGELDQEQIRFEKASEHGQPIPLDATFQWWNFRAWLYNMKKRHFALKLGNKPSIELISLTLRERRADPKKVQQIKERYRLMWMRPKQDITLIHQQVAKLGELPEGLGISPEPPDMVHSLADSQPPGSDAKTSRKVVRSK